MTIQKNAKYPLNHASPRTILSKVGATNGASHVSVSMRTGGRGALVYRLVLLQTMNKFVSAGASNYGVCSRSTVGVDPPNAAGLNFSRGHEMRKVCI